MPVPNLKHEFADLNGVRLHYVTAGGGKLIVFVHGFPEFWYEWRHQLAEFSRDYQVVALDTRGINLSSKPPEVEKYQMHHLAADVRALAEHLGHRKFTLVGHDWGGGIGWFLGASQPECLEKLVIINSPHAGVMRRELSENPAQPRAFQYVEWFCQPGMEQTLAASNFAALVEFLGRGLSWGFFDSMTEADKQACFEAWSQPGALNAGLNYYRVYGAPPVADAENVLDQIGAEIDRSYGADDTSLMVNVPTLVIWGELDSYLLTGCLDGLEKFVPDLTIRRVSDASHWIVNEQPELVNLYLREFLAD